MRALVVGINKYKTQRWLEGCVNDAINVRDTLIANAGLKKEDIKILQDEGATTEKIRESLRELAKGAVEGQRLYFHFSGHGDQLRTDSAEEPDGLDEVLCPYDFDFQPNNAIRDDDLIQVLKTIPATSDVIVTLDCCHSGDYSRRTSSTVRTPDQESNDVANARRSGVSRYNSIRAVGLLPNCLVISACQPTQLAYETTDRQAGAFTKAFFAQANASPRESMRSIVEIATTALSSFPQTPVMEGSDLLREESYAPASRSLSRIVLRPRPRSGEILWSQEFGFNAAGSRGTVGVRVTLIDGNFWLETFVNMFGPHPIMSVPLGGDVDETLAITLGFSLTVGVRNFSLEHEQLSFRLRIGVKTPFFPLIPLVTVVDAPISIPLSGLSRSTASIGSLADLVAFQALHAKPITHQPKSARDSGRSIEISKFICITAEAIFGDTIDIEFNGDNVRRGMVVNTNDNIDLNEGLFSIPPGGGLLKVWQYYFPQPRQPIYVEHIMYDAEVGPKPIHILPRGDNDPGGEYHLVAQIV